ncbi:hypothetical protein CWQ24_30185 (plasmid) [Klebsiella pneumoniae]|nr:hypothetical protein CWQ24_30185 [Klebsiella pneumoniae]
MRQQQDEPGRFSICSRQAAVVHLVSTESWFDRTVSADAAGIILTSLAVNRRLAAHHDSGNPALTHLYMLRDAQLWNLITFHPECNAIYAALD